MFREGIDNSPRGLGKLLLLAIDGRNTSLGMADNSAFGLEIVGYSNLLSGICFDVADSVCFTSRKKVKRQFVTPTAARVLRVGQSELVHHNVVSPQSST